MPNQKRDVRPEWARLGILFNVPLAKKTPDIEDVLIRTSEVMPSNARLLPTVMTWLTVHERLICRHRLARMAHHIADPYASAALGLTLDLVRSHTLSSRMNAVIAVCHKTKAVRPLFDIDRRSPAMAKLASAEACKLSRKWGLWTQEPELKTDVIRPVHWLMDRNPTLHYRAVFSGNLRASILTCLWTDPEAGRSESALAAACGVTRKALRDALDHLEFCGLIRRRPVGARTEIRADPSYIAA